MGAWQPLAFEDGDPERYHAGDPAELWDAAAVLVEALTARPWWHADAACRGMGPDLFFPERGGSIAEAQAVCATCSVVEVCGDTADAQGEQHGIWGGLTRRAARKAA